MKIGLIDPGTKKLTPPMPHAGLGYVAASLEKQGHTVALLDMEMATRGEIDAFFGAAFDVLGVTATSFTYRSAVGVLRDCKARQPEARTVIGGPHVSVALGAVLEDPVIDFAVYGEGEETMRELASLLAGTQGTGPRRAEGILGLIYRAKDGVAVNPPRPWNRDLDSLSFPSYRSLPMDRYESYSLVTSRGCPHQCSFCAASVLCGRQWRGRSPLNLLEEVQYLMSSWGKKPFAVCDDNFNVQPSRVKEFCGLLAGADSPVEWHCWAFRADRADPDMLKAMKEAGCRSVAVGVESADPRVLRNIRKNETLEEIEQGIRNIKAAGIICQTLNMIGNPGDTLDAVKETIAFNARLGVDVASFYLALPYPKTGLWEYVENNGRFLETDYTRFHHLSPEPVFETPEFTRQQRIEAHRLARGFELRTRLGGSLHRKAMRVLRGEFRGLAWADLRKSLASLAKLVLDLLLGRGREV